MKISLKQSMLRGLVITVVPLVMAGCHREVHISPNPTATGTVGCSNNPYLMKYGCSIERIQAAAENGSPDAQYALGYMYYYGIDTVQDKQTAMLWIQRSAAQGQPLAKKAWSLINSGGSFGDLHQAAAGSTVTTIRQTSRQASVIEQQPPENVDQLNAAQHNEPITEHLPAYHSQVQSAVVDNPNAGSTSESTAETSAPTIGDASHPAKQYNDPRLMNNAKPRVAAMNPNMNSNMNARSNSAPAASTAMANNSRQSYTVQLLASDKINDVKAFVAAHHLENQTHSYRTEMNGKPLYMLTYGQYATEKQAQSAMKQLPQDVMRHHPWVKSFAIVQKEVKSKKVVA